MNSFVTLASSKSGRVVLHAICMLRRPEHARWHWHGIRREIALAGLDSPPCLARWAALGALIALVLIA